MQNNSFLIQDWNNAIKAFRQESCEYLNCDKLDTSKYISDEQIKNIVMSYAVKTEYNKWIFTKQQHRDFIKHIAEFIQESVCVKAASDGVLEIYVCEKTGRLLYKPSKEFGG